VLGLVLWPRRETAFPAQAQVAAWARGTVARGWVAGPGCCLALLQLRLLLATGRKNASASSAFGLKMEKRTDLHFIIF
jgi:hypothetical protein